MSKNNKRVLWWIVFAAVMLALALNISGVLNVISTVWKALMPVILGIGIAFALNVPLRWFETKVFRFIDSKRHKLTWLRTTVSILVTVLLFIGLFVLAFAVIIPQFIETVKLLINNSSTIMYNAQVWVQNLLVKMNISADVIAKVQFNWSNVLDKLTNLIQASASKIATFATTFTTGAFSAIFTFVVAFAIAMYILVSKRRIKRFAIRACEAFLPDKPRDIVYHVAALTDKAFSNFIGGQFVEALILGMLCFIGMTVFGFPYAVVISVLTAVMALIPILGGIIATVVGAVLILTVSPIQALLFVLFIIILQQIEGNLIYPHIVGDSIGLPGVVVLSAVIIGSNLFGIVGILIGVPLMSLLYALTKEFIAYCAANKKKTHEREEEQNETSD